MLKQSTLIISTYNWPEALEACLKSVMKQSILPTEIIIADDGSTFETKDVICKYKKIISAPIIHVWHEDKGFRKTIILNKAIKKVSTDYIIQIDSDIILNKYFIEDHLCLAEKKCFVRGSRTILNNTISLNYLKYNRLPLLTKLFLSIEQPMHFVRLWPIISKLATRKVSSGEKVKGCNISFWKSDILEINGYNNELKGWGHEDEELCLRLVNLGVMKKTVRFSAIAAHLHHKLLSRKEESRHLDLLEEVKRKIIIRANNGLNEV